MGAVANGGGGLRCLSVRFTRWTVTGSCSVSRITVSTAASLFSSAFLPCFPW